jgi:hypothetical protein
MELGSTALRLTIGFQKRDTSEILSLSASAQSPTLSSMSPALSTMSFADADMVHGPER